MEQHARCPLLEKIDWVFTSECWTNNYPNTMAMPLTKPASDHSPYVISIGTAIPKSCIFRFENFWLTHPNFLEVVHNIWSQKVPEQDSAKLITAKFKRLNKGLKIWAKNHSNLAGIIRVANEFIFMWDFFEEYRPLDEVESRFWGQMDPMDEHDFLFWYFLCPTKWCAW